MTQRVQFDVVRDDVLTFPADVLALKFAQGLHGADLAVADALGLSEAVLHRQLARPGSHQLVSGQNLLAATRVLFVGVVSLWHFRYAQIREFAARVLQALEESAPQTRHLAVTIHGVNYGLDELESFTAQVGGFLDALAHGDCPPALERITFVERNAKRAGRLTTALQHLLPEGAPLPSRSLSTAAPATSARALPTAGQGSEAKPHVFVAMPFSDEFDDIYYYGIEPAVKAAGYLCERADTRCFPGDILDWIKARIQTAALVIADLTTANPNVYLEVGYAWGHQRPTVLLTRDLNDLKFDVRGQRCVTYKRIRDLEENLKRELAEMASGAASGRR
jgi:hypothetical protein